MTLPKPYYEEPGITIYHGDCRDILPHLPKVDLVLTDPPYGINWDGKVTRGPRGTGKQGPTKHYNISIIGDDVPFDPTPFLDTDRVIIWGYHHFANRIPNGSILVWIKRMDSGFGSFLSDADIAWMKGGHGVYCFRDLSLQADSKFKHHPTEKPLKLIEWCIHKSGHDMDIELVLDPFMGSGTTLVAAKNLGRQAIGIEIEEKYCAIAVQRLRQDVLPFSTAGPNFFLTSCGLIATKSQ